MNKNKKFKVWNIGRFLNFDGLLADPTRMIRDISKWPDPNIYGIVELLEICKQKYIIVENYQKYLEIFQSKRTLLDNHHVGNFHQQLGQKMLIKKK